jgi:hypothetical protein
MPLSVAGLQSESLLFHSPGLLNANLYPLAARLTLSLSVILSHSPCVGWIALLSLATIPLLSLFLLISVLFPLL